MVIALKMGLSEDRMMKLFELFDEDALLGEIGLRHIGEREVVYHVV